MRLIAVHAVLPKPSQERPVDFACLQPPAKRRSFFHRQIDGSGRRFDQVKPVGNLRKRKQAAADAMFYGRKDPLFVQRIVPFAANKFRKIRMDRIR